MVWGALTAGTKVPKDLKESWNQRKMKILNHMFDQATTLDDQDSKIGKAIADAHRFLLGSLKLDNLNLDTTKNVHSFLPKTVSWIPNTIMIDNTILYVYFLGNKLGGSFDESKWSEIFKLNESCFKSKGYKFNGKLYTDGISASILLQSPSYKSAYSAHQDKEDEEDDDDEGDVEYLFE